MKARKLFLTGLVILGSAFSCRCKNERTASYESQEVETTRAPTVEEVIEEADRIIASHDREHTIDSAPSGDSDFRPRFEPLVQSPPIIIRGQEFEPPTYFSQEGESLVLSPEQEVMPVSSRPETLARVPTAPLLPARNSEVELVYSKRDGSDGMYAQFYDVERVELRPSRLPFRGIVSGYFHGDVNKDKLWDFILEVDDGKGNIYRKPMYGFVMDGFPLVRGRPSPYIDGKLASRVDSTQDYDALEFSLNDVK